MIWLAQVAKADIDESSEQGLTPVPPECGGVGTLHTLLPGHRGCSLPVRRHISTSPAARGSAEGSTVALAVLLPPRACTARQLHKMGGPER